jgi:hypothetical protein
MTIIDRYLQAVRSFLPAGDQDDIIRELSEDIHAQVADQEAGLGRPLTESEEKALVREFGHPMLFAARYRPNQHLIGPAIFPIYWHVLKLAMIGALIVHGAIAMAMVAGGAAPREIIDPLVRFPFGVAVMVFGWVTLVFALLDLNLANLKWLHSWNPDALPALRPDGHSRLALLCEIVASTAFLTWWLAIPRFPFLVFGPAASFLGFTPSWQAVHLPITGLWSITLVTLWMMLLRPDWNRFRQVARLITHGFGLITASVLLRVSPLVALKDTPPPLPSGAGLVGLVNLGIQIGLVIFALASLWELVRELWRLQHARLTLPKTLV